MLLVGEKVDTFTYDGASALPSELAGHPGRAGVAATRFRLSMRHRSAGRHRRDTGGIALRRVRTLSRRCFRSRRSTDVAALEANIRRPASVRATLLILGVLEQLDRGHDPRHYRGVVRRCDRAGHGGSPWFPQRSFLAARRRSRLGYASRRRHRPRDRKARGLLRRRWGQPVFDPRALDGGEVSHSFHIHLLREPRISACSRTFGATPWVRRSTTTHFVGMDFADPDVDVQGIAKGLGARTEVIENLEEIGGVLARAFAHGGPSFLIVNREP